MQGMCLTSIARIYLWAQTELMEGCKSMLAMRSYFNFPEPCTDQGWLARKTQYWAGVSILGYKKYLIFLLLPFLSDSGLHYKSLQGLQKAKCIGLTVTLKAWNPVEYPVSGSRVKLPAHCYRNTLHHRLLLSLCLAQHLGQDPKKAAGPSWLQQGDCQCCQPRSPCFSPSSSGWGSDTLINRKTDYRLTWCIVMMEVTYMETTFFSLLAVSHKSLSAFPHDLIFFSIYSLPYASV